MSRPQQPVFPHPGQVPRVLSGPAAQRAAEVRRTFPTTKQRNPNNPNTIVSQVTGSRYPVTNDTGSVRNCALVTMAALRHLKYSQLWDRIELSTVKLPNYYFTEDQAPHTAEIQQVVEQAFDGQFLDIQGAQQMTDIPTIVPANITMFGIAYRSPQNPPGHVVVGQRYGNDIKCMDYQIFQQAEDRSVRVMTNSNELLYLFWFPNLQQEPSDTSEIGPEP